MNDNKKDPVDEFSISFSDLKMLFKKNRNKIYKTTLLFALLAFIIALVQPVVYQVEASFKEKSKSKSGLSDGMGAALVFMTDGPADSDALTMMSSRKLLEELVKDQGLQGVITKNEYHFPLIPFKTIKNNLIAEYATLKKAPAPIVDTSFKDLRLEQIVYMDEVPKSFRLSVISEDGYVIDDESGNRAGEGSFGSPFATDTFAFTILRTTPESLKGNSYSLKLHPIQEAARGLLKQFTFQQDKIDKSVLKIIHKYPDRKQAAKNLNALMDVYLQHLQCEHENLCQMQINYLKERQEDVGSQLESMMDANAEKLSSDLSSTGFATSEKAMEFLAANQQLLKEKLFSIDLTIKRLNNIQQEGSLDSELIDSSFDLDTINNITAEKRVLNQQLKSLYLSLKSPNVETNDDVDTLIDGPEITEMKQGLDINVTKDLYIGYVKELSNLESETRQHHFVIAQMDEPGFEITSLCTTLSDPVSMNMITRTNDLLLALKDYENRSSREQDRLLSDIAIQKNALKTHVQQSLTLLKLRRDFIKEKIVQLQKVLLSLTKEQLYILDNQLNSHLDNTLNNLKQEKTMIEENLGTLRLEMASFPEQWSAEQLISQQMTINKSLVEEVSRAVESKNITNNLEKFQSAPIDMAVPPIHPKPPHLILLTIAGAIFGAFSSFIWILCLSVVNGIEASPENLKTAGFHISGSLSQLLKKGANTPLLDSDLETLRRLIAHLTTAEEGDDTLLLLEGNGPDYAIPLAELLFRRGLKTLILDIRFDDYEGASSPGMLQYLEGKVKEPSKIREEKYDRIGSGGICRYSNELLGNQRFISLLEEVKKEYDWVIASSAASPGSAEATSLLKIFSCACISIENDPFERLSSCMEHAKREGSKTSFVFIDTGTSIYSS